MCYFVWYGIDIVEVICVGSWDLFSSGLIIIID